MRSNETLAVIPLTFATLTDVAFTANAAPPALSTEVVAVLFKRTSCSPTVIAPWFVPPVSLVTWIEVVAAPVAPAMITSLVVLNSKALPFS